MTSPSQSRAEGQEKPRPIKWDLKKQADIAARQFRALPKWARDVAYFSGGNRKG